jgi:putative transposase
MGFKPRPSYDGFLFVFSFLISSVSTSDFVLPFCWQYSSILSNSSSVNRKNILFFIVIAYLYDIQLSQEERQMKARYQYRFYPTDQQQQSLAQLFGCVRVVWNDALAICKQSEKKPKSAELQKRVITQAKKTEERAWLSEVSNIPLQQSIADLEIAFKNFFDSCKGKRKGRKVGYPKFKKRTSSQSARLTRGGFSIKGEEVYLAKIGNVSPVWSRKLPSIPSSVTVIKDCANRYFLSFVVEVEPIQINAKNQSVGIDLGIKTFAVISNGEKAFSPCYKIPDRKVRKLQKKLARQQKDSKRKNKTRIQIAKQHNQIADNRKDFLHKLSTKVVSENQTIVLEDLNVSGSAIRFRPNG